MKDGVVLVGDGIAFAMFSGPARSFVYNAEYAQKYREYEKTEMGKKLLDFRVSIIEEFIDRDFSVLDIGTAVGVFPRTLRKQGYTKARGFEVNPFHEDDIKDIMSTDLESDYHTYWDSLEHIPFPADYLMKARKGVFVSIPIFKDLRDMEKSKHFRPQEHVWYFTRPGLIGFMEKMGFDLKELWDTETRLGREDIETFFFSRV